MKTRIISNQLGKNGQNVDLLQVEQIAPTACQALAGQQLVTLRYRIRSNPHDYQSYAICERWDGEQWQELHQILPGLMQTPTGLHNALSRQPLPRINRRLGTTPSLQHHFEADVETLRNTAYDVLGFGDVTLEGTS